MSRETTWLDKRHEWEGRVRDDYEKAQIHKSFKSVDKQTPQPQPWDNVDLGERCEQSDLYKIACGHCRGISDDGVPGPESAS